MIFTSFNFLIFFPILLVLYWLTASNYRWLTLLIASYFFYLNIKPVFVLILIVITLVTYLFTRLMDKTNVDSKKKNYFILNVILVLSPLLLFKYFSFINSTIISFLESVHLRWPLPEIRLMLPVGISFYTFMAIGYSIDVYNEEIKAEKNIGIVALFLSFFPLILSGPIERAKNMLPQFKSQRNFDYGIFVQGLRIILWGYFMKLVVADRVGIYIDAIYNNISQHNGTSLLFASFLYPFQIYADLGGYSLIALGTAKTMGINVMQNFKRPFCSTSMAELWRRYHISFISWLTDYIFTPLSFTFRKYKIWGIVIALMITFFISGIWHGATLTFIVWGLIQGIYLSIDALTHKRRLSIESKHNLRKKAWYISIGISSTFILFAASQIFGRATSIKDALMIFSKIFSSPGNLFIGTPSYLVYSIIGVTMILFKDFTDEYFPTKFQLFENKHKFVRILSYTSIMIIILLIGVFDGSQFIYFQF